MSTVIKTLTTLSVFLVLTQPAKANNSCIEQAALNANAETTVAELRKQCPAQSEKISTPLVQRKPRSIAAHKANYLLPMSYSQSPQQLGLYGYELQRNEVEFQLSLKFPIGPKFGNQRVQIYGAYSNHSWWQAFNSKASAPFRETNHEPELFADIPFSLPSWGLDQALFRVGVSHQSNGQSGLASRSWNRIYASLTLEQPNWTLAFKPWLRIPEKAKTSPSDPKGDDNPDIEHFLGHFELSLLRRFPQGSSISALIRHNPKYHKGAIKLGYSHPINPRFKAYVEAFDGYGESLIDYQYRNLGIGIGILLTDWL